MAHSSAEYEALVISMDKMTTEISADPLTVANKLVSRRVIPLAASSSALQLQTNELKASRLVNLVSNKVSSFPDVFQTFIEVLNGMPWLQRLAEWIDNEYKKLKAEGLKVQFLKRWR